MWHHKATPPKPPRITFEVRANAGRRPFDPDAFKRLPEPRRKDPPYRPWWVIEPKDDE